jgi:small conductance mechanosensitive channel
VAGISILTKIVKLFDLSTVLTAAGIGGVAIGFGSQSLVKDIISGFFILLEDQLSIGDRVSIGNMTGIVEEIELRILKIRNYTGELYMVPYGEIKSITNYTRGDSAILVNIKVSYEESINKVVELVNDVCQQVSKEFDTITESPKVLGVNEFEQWNYIITVFGKAKPMEQWNIEREIRKRVIEKSEQLGIKLGGIQINELTGK